MVQLSLFANERKPRPASHRADPETSHEAELKHRDNGRCALHADIALKLVRQNPDLTACELWWIATGDDRETIGDLYELRRRLSDLRDSEKVPDPIADGRVASKGR